MTKKINSTYKTISEVLEILNSNIDTQKKIELHTMRFWETQFKQLNPKRINNRRYYDNKNIDTLLKIQFLLKNQGMTISGVKKILDNNNLKEKKKVKISNFGTFEIRYKKQREGRNPKTKEAKLISERHVVLFKPSKDFKKFVNNKSA